MIWGFMAAILAVFLEYHYRTYGTFPWFAVPLGVVLPFLIYQSIRPENAPGLIVGIAAFGLGTLLARASVSHFLLGEPLAKGTLVAAACMLVANIVGRLWR